MEYKIMLQSMLIYICLAVGTFYFISNTYEILPKSTVLFCVVPSFVIAKIYQKLKTPPLD